MDNKNLVCYLSTGVCGYDDSGAAIEKINISAVHEKIKILYFTDPICSFCWALEPIIKKLSEEYGDYFTLEHRMGGLLKNWNGFMDAGNGIHTPSDVAHHWEEIGQWSGMPIDGGVWLEDPLKSSYPPSIAFKAAELQDKHLADLFLRRIREMVFVEKKNIAKEENLLQAAMDVRLDADLLAKDISNFATQLLFEKDMQLARELNVSGFPTLILHNKNGQGVMIRGFQPYAQYVSALEQIVGTPLKPRIVTESAEDIVNKYHFVSSKEISEVLGSPPSTIAEQLEQLAQLNKIKKVQTKNGNFWKKITEKE